jgi:hypothetical protein
VAPGVARRGTTAFGFSFFSLSVCLSISTPRRPDPASGAGPEPEQAATRIILDAAADGKEAPGRSHRDGAIGQRTRSEPGVPDAEGQLPSEALSRLFTTTPPMIY